MNSFIDDLSDLPSFNNLDVRSSGSTPKAKKERPTFPCESCNGTGKYQGVRVHQEKADCFACKGKGYFYTSYADRQAARVQARVRKATKLAVAQDSFNSEFPGLIEAMRPLASWNSFVADLLRQFDERGTLTANQAAAAQRQIDKAAARDAQRAAEKAAKEAAAPVVELENIRALLETAKSNGLKKPGIWYGDLKITEAPANGKNAGALYIKKGGEYAGKLVGGKFMAAWEFRLAGIDAELAEIAASPAEAIRAKGKETNRCCCCGRELTDPVSVANGIGPVCAENFGL